MSKIFLKHCEDNLELIKERKDSVYSLKSLCSVIGYSDHGRNTGALATFCKERGIDLSHFTSNGKVRYTTITKICPQCGTSFTTNAGPKEKHTCSRTCANNYFKQAKKTEITPDQYAYRAKQVGMTSCAICGESTLVDIHHIDHDRNNNNLDNLVPLCPTHHMYLHRGKADLIMDRLIKYLDTRSIAG